MDPSWLLVPPPVCDNVDFYQMSQTCDSTFLTWSRRSCFTTPRIHFTVLLPNVWKRNDSTLPNARLQNRDLGKDKSAQRWLFRLWTSRAPTLSVFRIKRERANQMRKALKWARGGENEDALEGRKNIAGIPDISVVFSTVDAPLFPRLCPLSSFSFIPSSLSSLLPYPFLRSLLCRLGKKKENMKEKYVAGFATSST